MRRCSRHTSRCGWRVTVTTICRCTCATCTLPSSQTNVRASREPRHVCPVSRDVVHSAPAPLPHHTRPPCTIVSHRGARGEKGVAVAPWYAKRGLRVDVARRLLDQWATRPLQHARAKHLTVIVPNCHSARPPPISAPHSPLEYVSASERASGSSTSCMRHKQRRIWKRSAPIWAFIADSLVECPGSQSYSCWIFATRLRRCRVKRSRLEGFMSCLERGRGSDRGRIGVTRDHRGVI